MGSHISRCRFGIEDQQQTQQDLSWPRIWIHLHHQPISRQCRHPTPTCSHLISVLFYSINHWTAVPTFQPTLDLSSSVLCILSPHPTIPPSTSARRHLKPNLMHSGSCRHMVGYRRQKLPTPKFPIRRSEM